jgi:hypothetical protein
VPYTSQSTATVQGLSEAASEPCCQPRKFQDEQNAGDAQQSKIPDNGRVHLCLRITLPESLNGLRHHICHLLPRSAAQSAPKQKNR